MDLADRRLGYRSKAAWPSANHDHSSLRHVSLEQPRNANLEPSQERTLPPGAYQDSSIKRDATLRLSSGTYYFNSLSTEPNSKLVIDKRNGPVNIYVRTTLLHKGTMVDAGGAKANLLLGYFGSASVVLESTFVGTLIAPSATIVLAATPQPHVGAIFANAVEVRADAHLQFVPLPTLLISDVTTDKTSLCANDSVLVHVEADAGGSSAPVAVGVNGNPGNDQYVQLTGKPGARHISVTAQVLGGYTSTRDVVVQVNDCGSAPVLPVVRVNANRFHENTGRLQDQQRVAARCGLDLHLGLRRWLADRHRWCFHLARLLVEAQP